MAKVNMKKRLDYFDQLKGVAILFVVVGHILFWSLGVKDTGLNNMYIIFYMPLFFYISGFWAFKNHESALDVFKNVMKTSLHLLVPFLTFCFLLSLFKGTAFVNLLSRGGGSIGFCRYYLFCNYFL